MGPASFLEDALLSTNDAFLGKFDLISFHCFRNWIGKQHEKNKPMNMIWRILRLEPSNICFEGLQ